MQQQVKEVHAAEEILTYITRLAVASRQHAMVSLGISPRGALAVLRMAKARAFMEGRDYVIPQDVQEIFVDVCSHRLVLNSKAKISDKNGTDVLREVLETVEIEADMQEKK